MSRTYRRKNCHLKSYSVERVEDVSAWDLRAAGVNDAQTCVIRQSVRFHSDAGSTCGTGGVPRWFRRRLNKQIDRANKVELFRCVGNDCWDDFLAMPYLSNAGWYWW